ncbi:MAG: 3-phosphoshikimate 1-carboxyvinyltransferase [Bifidobacteriaceae bacterium]|jgi:3-phosphoshikimate 1-carboxyvinyltransferase|nr:3-phosphoshikimate 1-carboxyvinyltransferase [Bifidobacteriaceae bacterium]
MKIKVYPSRLSGVVTAPPSKSVAHRAIIAAALAKGTSHITNIAYSDDILATIGAVKKLGAKTRKHRNSLEVIGCRAYYDVSYSELKETLETTEAQNPIIVDAKESGSTLRFMLPLLSLLNKKVRFVGSKRLLERPLDAYEKIFAEQGLLFTKTDDYVEICGAIGTSLDPMYYDVSGNVSSQFITGLLIALPLATGPSYINITGAFESKSYVDLTIDVLKKFRIKPRYLESTNDTLLGVPGCQEYHRADYCIEGDYSNAAFFLAQNDITGNDNINVAGLNPRSKQGDRQIVRLIKNKKHKIDLSDIPDLGPILATRAAFKKGKTVIYNAKRLRLKESDRIYAIETELKKCGVDISSTDDCIQVYGMKKGKKYAASTELSSHNDHRIAMSLCIAALNFETPTVIDGVESINKSYPNFLRDFKRLGAKFEVLEV